MTLKINSDLELRQLQMSDSKDIFKIIDNQRTYLGKWLPFVEFTKKQEDSEFFVRSVVNFPQDKLEYTFSIRKKNKLIGLIGFKGTDTVNKITEIGYWISQEFQKQGIVSRSVEILCDFAFDDLGLNRIVIKCAVDNQASINIPKRLGFIFEGIERDGELLSGNVFTDLEVYSKLRSDS